MIGKEEYLFLREEILKYIDAVQNYRNAMYAAVVAIYAFAFTQSEPLIFLVPIFIIIPIYKICIEKTSSMCRTGAYLLVFLEGEEFHWETRLHKYNEMYAVSVKKSTVSPYSICILVSIALCMIRINYNCISSPDNIVRIVICAAASIVCFIIIKKGQINYIKEKEMYIDRWRHIKAIEDTISKH